MFKISKGLRIKMSLFPSSCRAFCSIPSDLHQFEVQWWISSFILQTSYSEDVNLWITSFWLCKIKRLKIFFFSPWFPASWARSRSSTNPAFYTDFSPLLDFSGSAGFGTWRIFVPHLYVSSRPDALLSTVPSVQTTCHFVQTPDRPCIIHPDDVEFCLDPSLCQEASVPACIRPDDSTARPDASQWLISFKFFPSSNKGRLIQPSRRYRFPSGCAHPHKARIEIQKQPSGRLSVWSGRAFIRYGNCEFNFNRPDACLPWSERALDQYGNCVLKINCLDGHPPWFGRTKPYMEITCSGRATIQMTVPHRSDAGLKHERFSAKVSEILVAQLSIRTAHVHRPDGTRIFYSSHPFEPSAYK